MFACLHSPGNLALLVQCAEHFSPLIEETSPDTVLFDVHGLKRLYGSTEQIAIAMQRRVGIHAHLAIAGNPDAAVHAARGLSGPTILPVGREAAILAPLPVHLLGGSPDFAQTLDLWGIRNFGEFAALPRLGVTARLGEEGTHLHQLAEGAGHRQLLLRVDPLVFREEKEFEDPIDGMEPLLFLLSQMLRDLCERLRFHGRATNELHLRLKLEGAADHRIVLRLPVPMLNAKVLLKLLQLELNGRPPQAPVEIADLELAPVEPRTLQNGLFQPAVPEPEMLEVTLARIRGLVGAANVGAPELVNTHRPDAFRMNAIALSKDAAGSIRPRLVLRRFRPPQPAQVWCTGHGKPTRVSSSLGSGGVVACAGPWHSAGDWWTEEQWSREEWDVEIAGLGLFRIFYDQQQKRWSLDGNYD